MFPFAHATFDGTTYAGDRVAEVPLSPAAPPLKIILGHLPDNPRRLVKAFVDQVRVLFSEEESRRFLVRLPDAK